MKMLSQRLPAFWLVLIVCSIFLLACDLASLVSKDNSTSSGQAQAQPTQSSGSKATPVPVTSKDSSSRVSDSINRLLMMDKKVLDSYHLEAGGTSPVWNKSQSKVESQAFTLSADVSGDNVHFVKRTKTDKEKVTEGYILNANAKDGGTGYGVDGGKVTEDLFIPLEWVALPLDYGMPLIFASVGSTLTGQEAVDGRPADRFDVDLSKAPTGTEGMLKGFGFGMQSSKGTAWVDKQNGALLKMNINYESDVLDGGKVVGKGSGHIELVVTKVGQVTVKLPDATSTGPTAPATTAAKGTATFTPTAAPAANVSRVGQRVVLQGVALTVTKVDALDTYGGRKADAGYKWVIATVTVENTSNTRITVEEEQFNYVDKNGAILRGLLNGPSAPGNTGADVFARYGLTPGGKAPNKTLPIQVKKELMPGLQLLFTIDKANSISVDLGL